MLKGVLIDYGGTIDTNGRHWANVIWEAYMSVNVNVTKEQFMNAYAFGERALAINPIIKPYHTFKDVLCLKLEQQLEFLSLKGSTESDKIDKMVGYCMEIVRGTIKKAKPTLDIIHAQYPMVLVSNFYGNIQAVLRDLHIDHYFNGVVESAIVGVRKPNPEIYSLGVAEIGLLPQECVVIGDSFKKDILSGKEAGCKTLWLNVDGFIEDLEGAGAEIADIQITDFSQIPAALEKLNAN
ncbi:HAD family hydrolase [Olivibacter domesticus]|uniref:Putative hydrolase of the HAD superfamily n=1 Tax=Olivibacter domesticus TaxID=407022 RepID=A0A1H7QTS7_OLID1|nr:HAD family hydrolase [Olivibacter domesticus]SEL51401.1 putative hydrolase of the HAD superfamily [Olivibacter domesticus]